MNIIHNQQKVITRQLKNLQKWTESNTETIHAQIQAIVTELSGEILESLGDIENTRIDDLEVELANQIAAEVVRANNADTSLNTVLSAEIEALSQKILTEAITISGDRIYVASSTFNAPIIVNNSLDASNNNAVVMVKTQAAGNNLLTLLQQHLLQMVETEKIS